MVPLLLLLYVLRIVIKKSVNNRKTSMLSLNYALKISYNFREINKIYGNVEIPHSIIK